MTIENDIRTGRHCVFAMHVHLIFVTKYRKSVFDGDAIERLGNHFRRVANDFEAKVVEYNGEENISTCWWSTIPKFPSVLWCAA